MKKFIGTMLVLSMGMALVACGKAPEETAAVTEAPEAVATTVAETEAPLAPVIASRETEDVASQAATIPLNEEAYNEFAEPVMYEVLEDCVAWTDNGLQTVSRTVAAGSIVNAVATDGYYLVLDDQEVVEISHLQIFE
ncbi:MAG: hypothetical protein MJ094_08965 [Saccharofermentans sp.]|nr:hypothetical protein [Saccharofermentans sp.]